MMVEWSLSRKSKTLTEPSAEAEAKTSGPPQAMSWTSLSCAMSCVSTHSLSISQTVHVVSMDDVPTLLTFVSFQSNEVNGAQNSEFLLFANNARSSILPSSCCLFDAFCCRCFSCCPDVDGFSVFVSLPPPPPFFKFLLLLLLLMLLFPSSFSRSSSFSFAFSFAVPPTSSLIFQIRKKSPVVAIKSSCWHSLSGTNISFVHGYG
mmetsp:Transcript_8022/g.26464  ORF Transcript_8022/g.26464 Transcript_8022/m.26464 type:complete len:205 (-) Transcript_8022:227-841(-)